MNKIRKKIDSKIKSLLNFITSSLPAPRLPDYHSCVPPSEDNKRSVYLGQAAGKHITCSPSLVSLFVSLVYSRAVFNPKF